MKVRGWTLATSWWVVTLWSLLSMGVALTSLAALFTPSWFVRDAILMGDLSRPPRLRPPVVFGVWVWCVGGAEDQRCGALGESVGGQEAALPSVVWVMVGALYGGGGALLGVTGLATLVMPFLPHAHARAALAHVAANIQAAAVSLEAVALVLYPLGLGSPFARQQCGGGASLFASGDCVLGYAYLLAVVSSALAAYCPVLARLTTFKDYSYSWSNLNYL